VFGGGNIRYFILAMVIGFVIGCYSSIFVASPVWYDIKNRA
ncbi:MAG: protein translocase subunit SecF, partial [Clostridia bacterium]|nr:protein translocase subunit SecF [Clostridia bacterium]